jgi:hypothetical protein
MELLSLVEIQRTSFENGPKEKQQQLCGRALEAQDHSLVPLPEALHVGSSSWTFCNYCSPE